MHGIPTELAGRVDYFTLNWDDKSIDDLRQDLEISGRSQYLLVDGEGNVLRRWFGPLNSTLVEEVESLLAEAGY